MAKPSSETPVPPPRGGDAEREQRLAAALRANLRRRKAATVTPRVRTKED